MKSPLNPAETVKSYPAESIVTGVQTAPVNYAEKLLSRKFEIVWQNYHGGLVVDLCCGTGLHLLHYASKVERGVGVDFVPEYISRAKSKADSEAIGNLEFVVGDVRTIPVEAGAASLLYSLSALYILPNLEKNVEEISRVLAPGGRCVLDLGNRVSLNTICARQYPAAAPLYSVTVGEMLTACERAGLRVNERYSFQILPLWADRPRWLALLLAPFWERLMKKTISGRMLDEWISSLPLVRRFAFRHVLVCEKV